MIEKINSIGFNSQSKKNYLKNTAQNNIEHNTTHTTKLLGSKFANSLKAMNISFGSNLTPLEKSIITDSEIRIPNLLEINEQIRLPRKKMPKGLEKLNAAGLNVDFLEAGNKKIYTISNDKDNTIALVEVKNDTKADNLPVITYKQGKYMPELTIKDESLKGKSIKMLAGSKMVGSNFKIVMPGQYEATPGKGYESISFTGNIAITTLNKEARTLEAVRKYDEDYMQYEAIKGDYADFVQENNPNIIIPAGGFGERFKNITREAENKPSAKLPTNPSYRIIGTTLGLAASANLFEGMWKDNVIFLSQNHEIKEDGKQIFWTPKFKTDGGAIAEGMKRGLINTEADSIILNADIFTNADITRAYHALKTLPNAGLVIPYYPVNSERAKAFGLLGIEKDTNNNMQIKQFVEKPAYTDEAPDPNDFSQPGDYDKAMTIYDEAQLALNPNDEETFLANPGMYFLSSEASKVLMAMGILTPEDTGLGGSVMPKIIQLINEGKLVDKNGNKLKAYTVPLERKGGAPAVWDDIGTAEAYLKLIKDVANETKVNGTGEANKYYGIPKFVMNDFASNVDLTTGIVFDSGEAQNYFKDFKQKHEISDVKGNVFVAGR